MADTAKSLYEKHVQSLPKDQKLELVQLIARELRQLASKRAKRNILELRGLGAEIWETEDAQDDVDALRDEWDR